MASEAQKLPTEKITPLGPRRTSTNSSLPSIKTPRAARFAEATAVNSPIEPSKPSRNPFADPPAATNHYMPQPQPSDVGFGYLSSQQPAAGVEMDRDSDHDPTPQTPRSPLKSALKSPGAPRRDLEALRSPTFHEEKTLDTAEEGTDKEQRKDLKVKFRVRVAKMLLRGVNFSCSLIVLAMLASTFAIFNATRHLPKRNNLPPWADKTPIWPQVTLLTIASISLLFSVLIISTWFRKGHRKAEKVAAYYTTFAVAFFIFTIVMWIIGAAVLNSTKEGNGGSNIWGWSCRDGQRKDLFEDDVSYDLICRLQNWSLVCCFIEIIVEIFVISIYGLVFYRFYSKRKLRKSMAVRDRARSDLYLAQLRSQSAPNTPGFGPLSPRGGGWQPTPNPAAYKDPYIAAEAGEKEGVQYAVAAPPVLAQPKPFSLQAPPTKAGLNGIQTTSLKSVTPPSDVPSTPMSPVYAAERQNDHVPAAPGEQQYAPVSIPGSYVPPPLASPGFAPQQHQQQQAHHGFNFGLGDQR